MAGYAPFSPSAQKRLSPRRKSASSRTLKPTTPPRVEQFSSQGERPQVLFRADGPVLGLQAEDPAQEQQDQHGNSERHDQRRAIEPVVVPPGTPEVHARADERENKQGEQNEVEHRDELSVVSVILSFHPSSLPDFRRVVTNMCPSPTCGADRKS